LRPLAGEATTGGGTDVAEGGCGLRQADRRAAYENNLDRLKRLHHHQCLFNGQIQWIPDLTVSFDDEGVLYGEFTATTHHQGYKGRVHGGLVAAIIDASMAQCLMGHGALGYTADLTIKYRHPLTISSAATFVTRIVGVNVGMLYTLNCEIVQKRKLVAEATGRFYKFA
jgi:acyl-coenzyme A thioesterase PaaI-like protein